MKCSHAVLLLTLCVAPAISEQVRANPLGKVLELMDTLAAKVTKEGEAEAKAYGEYMEWCDDTKKETGFAIETATKDKAKLEAKIVELTSNIEVAGSKIEELGASVAQAEAELKNATLIREKEAADFSKSEQELMDVSDTLGRAIGILEKEMSKSAASLAQVDTSSTANMLQALGAILDAAAFPSSDQKKLAAFVQARQAAEDEDMAAPAASTYESQSGGIVEVLEDMKEKAESELSDLRKTEDDVNKGKAILEPDNIYPYYDQAIHKTLCGDVVIGLGWLVFTQVAVALLLLPFLIFVSDRFLTIWHRFQREGDARAPLQTEMVV